MSEENAGSKKWWDSPGSQEKRPEDPEEKASSIHLMTIPYTENVPSALEVNYLMPADSRNLKASPNF